MGLSFIPIIGYSEWGSQNALTSTLLPLRFSPLSRTYRSSHRHFYFYSPCWKAVTTFVCNYAIFVKMTLKKKKERKLECAPAERVRQHQPHPLGRGQADRERSLRVLARAGGGGAARQDVEGLRRLPGRADHRARTLRPLPPEGRAVRGQRGAVESGTILFSFFFSKKQREVF